MRADEARRPCVAALIVLFSVALLICYLF